MGGFGSGRRSEYGNTTADLLQLDVRRWQRRGCLEQGNSYSWRWSRNGEQIASIIFRIEGDRAFLSYRHRRNGSEWQAYEYPVTIEWTPCNYGGNRAWFRCPAKGCGRRVAILYCGGVFACRRCYRLSYECQKEAPHYRALRKAQSIHEKLGGTGIIDDPVFKPKGMHWRTFNRQFERFREAESRAVPPWLLSALGYQY